MADCFLCEKRLCCVSVCLFFVGCSFVVLFCDGSRGRRRVGGCPSQKRAST
jgi:hypothetical protein